MASTNGGEYASACPFCGGTDRFRTWPNEGNGGRYWCRSCKKSGDAIQLLRDKRGMSYIEACQVLSMAPKIYATNKCTQPKRTVTKFQPRTTILPPIEWLENAGMCLEWAEKQLWNTASGKKAVGWLNERGINNDSIKHFRVGWNPKDQWRDREAWGLTAAISDKTGKPKKLWFPQGLLIPSIVDNQVIRLRFRRSNPGNGARYILLAGSNTRALVIPGDPAAVMIVESELDAILIAKNASDMVTAIALGNAQSRPDTHADKVLKKAKTILVSLDSDPAGAKEAWQWWPLYYPNSKRWPCPVVKDPGEMSKSGFCITDWVRLGIVSSLGDIQAEKPVLKWGYHKGTY